MSEEIIVKEKNYRQEEIQEMLNQLIPEPMKWLELKVDTWLYENYEMSARVVDKFDCDDTWYMKPNADTDSIKDELINCLKNFADDYSIFDATSEIDDSKRSNESNIFGSYESKVVNLLKFKPKEGCNKLAMSMSLDTVFNPLFFDSDEEFIEECINSDELKVLYCDKKSMIQYFVHAICKRNFLQKIYSK